MSATLGKLCTDVFSLLQWCVGLSFPCPSSLYLLWYCCCFRKYLQLCRTEYLWKLLAKHPLPHYVKYLHTCMSFGVTSRHSETFWSICDAPCFHAADLVHKQTLVSWMKVLSMMRKSSSCIWVRHQGTHQHGGIWLLKSVCHCRNLCILYIIATQYVLESFIAAVKEKKRVSPLANSTNHLDNINSWPLSQQHSENEICSSNRQTNNLWINIGWLQLASFRIYCVSSFLLKKVYPNTHILPMMLSGNRP